VVKPRLRVEEVTGEQVDVSTMLNLIPFAPGGQAVFIDIRVSILPSSFSMKFEPVHSTTPAQRLGVGRGAVVEEAEAVGLDEEEAAALEAEAGVEAGAALEADAAVAVAVAVMGTAAELAGKDTETEEDDAAALT
jgi:hypothetical protein